MAAWVAMLSVTFHADRPCQFLSCLIIKLQCRQDLVKRADDSHDLYITPCTNLLARWLEIQLLAICADIRQPILGIDQGAH